MIFLRNKNQPFTYTPIIMQNLDTLDFDQGYTWPNPLGFAVCTRMVHLWMRGNVNLFLKWFKQQGGSILINDRRMNDIIHCIHSQSVIYIPCNNQCWLVIEKTITPVINPGIDNLPVGYWFFKNKKSVDNLLTWYVNYLPWWLEFQS